jgi:hypothetical protein
MKISHEVPKQLFEESLKFNDYDYALVHLFDKDPEYLQFYKNCVGNNRHVILDNSIFELGEAYDNESFAKWVNELKPTEYIIPDALEDLERTCEQARMWFDKYSDLPGKTIGVVQGKNYFQMVDCYQYLDRLGVDKIAISFDYSWYEEVVPHPNKYMSWMLGRATLLTRMMKDGVINKSKPHHLLGCGLPQEFSLYSESEFNWIESLDTSNPVVHGMLLIPYRDMGLTDKLSLKLADKIDTDINSTQREVIDYNVRKFRDFVNG